jgi:hypothetical protein
MRLPTCDGLTVGQGPRRRRPSRPRRGAGGLLVYPLRRARSWLRRPVPSQIPRAQERDHTLARRIFGNLAPEVSFRQQLGQDFEASGQEPLLVYVMTRIQGISYLNFILEYSFPKNIPENMAR